MLIIGAVVLRVRALPRAGNLRGQGWKEDVFAKCEDTQPRSSAASRDVLGVQMESNETARPHTGDAFTIPLGGGKYYLAHVMADHGLNQNYVVVFDVVVDDRDRAIDGLQGATPLFSALVLDTLFTEGRWDVIGRSDGDPNRYLPAYRVSTAPDEWYEESFDARRRRLASVVEIEALPLRTTCSPTERSATGFRQKQSTRCGRTRAVNLTQGDLFTIPVGDGTAYVAHVVGVLRKKNFYFVVYDFRTDETSAERDAEEALQHDVVLAGQTMSTLFVDMGWQVVGTAPVDADRWLPAYKVTIGDADSWFVVDFSEERRRPATAEEVEDLQFRTTRAPAGIAAAVRALAGTAPWEDRFDELLPADAQRAATVFRAASEPPGDHP
ncbi:Imm26 family immunity protein [Frigoribacterium sp. R86507]|uniref:Imm26 family immunity protein n=1 Tax=Frigoribacterium sp. R86507 TaxID=3093850 RepID=UPI0037C9661A